MSWFLNRAAAGIVAAGLTGALVAFLLSASEQSFWQNLQPYDFFVLYIGACFGAVLGAPTAILVMCFSKARLAPWRSIPVLILGTTIGGLIVMLPVVILRSENTALNYTLLIVGATVGGVVASVFLRWDRGNGRAGRQVGAPVP